jgi:branched-chain amino acid transport system ATP-binding protein
MQHAFGALNVLRGVNARFVESSVTAIMGKNGSGKSTLLKCVAALVHPDHGDIWLNDDKVASRQPWQRSHAGIAWTFQDVGQALSASIDMLIAISRRDGNQMSNPVDARYCENLMGISEEYRSRPWQTLSFGQRKIGAFLVALARNPKVLLLDEPVAGVEERALENIGLGIEGFASEGGIVVIVEHNRTFIERFCDRALILSDGVVAHDSTPQSLFADSAALRMLT